MGIRTTNNTIKLVKRPNSDGGVSSAPIDSISLTQKKYFSTAAALQGQIFDIEPIPRSRQEWVPVAKKIFEKLYTKKDWADGEVMFNILPNQSGYRSAEFEGKFDFQLYRRGQKKTTLLNGTIEHETTRENQRYGGYFMKVKIASLKKGDVDVPFGVKTPDAQEISNLEKMVNQVASGNPITLESGVLTRFASGNLVYYLSQYLRNNVFNGNTIAEGFNTLVQMNYVGSDPDGNARIQFYRKHQKKNTHYEATVEAIQMPPTDTNPNFVRAVQLKSIKKI